MYLNNAGASITSETTHNIIVEHLQLERQVGAYQAATLSESKIQDFYVQAALSINAPSPNNIAFVDSASRGWNLVIEGLPINKGDKILTLSSEFGTNLINLYKKTSICKAELIIHNCDFDGTLDLNKIEDFLKSGVKTIVLSHAIAHGSIVNPVYEIGILASKYGAIYIVDGCQSLGNIPVDVQRMKCDAFITTGRKWLRGPRGTGFIYIKPKAKIKESQLDLSSSSLVLDKNEAIIGLHIIKNAKRFELWERNIAALLGLTNAIKESNSVIKTKLFSNKEQYANNIRKVVSANDKLKIIGSISSKSGICGFFLKNPDLESSLINNFKNIGLNVSTMNHWNSPLQFPKNGVKNIFRISPHYYTNVQYVDSVMDELIKF